MLLSFCVNKRWNFLQTNFYKNFGANLGEEDGSLSGVYTSAKEVHVTTIADRIYHLRVNGL